MNKQELYADTVIQLKSTNSQYYNSCKHIYFKDCRIISINLKTDSFQRLNP